MPMIHVFKVDPRDAKAVADFINAMQEIAGTTGDPDTASNIRAALAKLFASKGKLWVKR